MKLRCAVATEYGVPVDPPEQFLPLTSQPTLYVDAVFA
jgi:hypothetical protein